MQHFPKFSWETSTHWWKCHSNENNHHSFEIKTPKSYVLKSFSIQTMACFHPTRHQCLEPFVAHGSESLPTDGLNNLKSGALGPRAHSLDRAKTIHSRCDEQSLFSWKPISSTLHDPFPRFQHLGDSFYTHPTVGEIKKKEEKQPPNGNPSFKTNSLLKPASTGLLSKSICISDLVLKSKSVHPGTPWSRVQIYSSVTWKTQKMRP